MNRVVVLTPHFFGAPSGAFRGGSTQVDARSARFQTVVAAHAAAGAAFRGAGLAVTQLVVGYGDQSLLPVDIDASKVVDDPRQLVFHAVEVAQQMVPDFDYVAIVEDDLLVTTETVRVLLDLLVELPLDEVVVPNRVEEIAGASVCIDLVALPGWTDVPVRQASGCLLAQPRNLHSGFLFMDRSRFERAYAVRAHTEPTIIIGDFMASALWNVHAGLTVRRAIPSDTQLTIVHQDSWLLRAADNGFMMERPLPELIADIRRQEATLASSLPSTAVGALRRLLRRDRS